MSSKKAIVEQVVAGLILAAILYACSFIPGFYSAIWKFVQNGWKYIWEPVQVPRCVFWFVLTCLIVLVIRFLVRTFKRPSEPSVFDYRQDTILGLCWRWNYNSKGVCDLWCYCPTCDTILVGSVQTDYSEWGQGRNTIRLNCETCGRQINSFEGNQGDLIARVERQIERIQRTGDWKKRIPSPIKD